MPEAGIRIARGRLRGKTKQSDEGGGLTTERNMLQRASETETQKYTSVEYYHFAFHFLKVRFSFEYHIINRLE